MHYESERYNALDVTTQGTQVTGGELNNQGITPTIQVDERNVASKDDEVDILDDMQSNL